MKSRKIIVTEAAVVCALCSLGTVCLPAQTAESLAANRSMSYAAILSKSGTIYTGVCIDTCSTLGICAERNAIFNMVTNGEQEIKKVLAILGNLRHNDEARKTRERVALRQKVFTKRKTA